MKVRELMTKNVIAVSPEDMVDRAFIKLSFKISKMEKAMSGS